MDVLPNCQHADFYNHRVIYLQFNTVKLDRRENRSGFSTRIIHKLQASDLPFGDLENSMFTSKQILS